MPDAAQDTRWIDHRLGDVHLGLAASRTAARRRCSSAALRRRSAWRTGATSACPSRPSCSSETARALASARLPRRERDDPAQAGRARARRQRKRSRARDRRGQHAHLRRRTARSRRRTPTPRPDRRAWAPRRQGMSALVLGAGGSARAAVWALREAGAARCRSGIAPPSGPSRWRASSARERVATPGPRGPAGQLHFGGTATLGH